MKNTPVSILAWCCMILAAFLAGMFVGRNFTGGEIQVSQISPQVSASTPATDTPPTANNSQQDGKVNINTADLYTLTTLSGIGETYAQRIIDYRNANGPFERIEDIMNVAGIGEKRFNDIKDYITTGG